ncbi:MAG: mechanosensitive ion channel family protein [Gammaproteobacteria bacterium]|nr:mechanosensitive ion channel family protein [Gammaproteobacteria bacterium]
MTSLTRFRAVGRYRQILSLIAILAFTALLAVPSAADPLTDLLTGAGPAQGSPPAQTIAKEATSQDDRKIRDRLQRIYSEIDAMRGIQVVVNSGVVEVTGEVDSPATAARATQFARQVEGVVDVQDDLVVNRDVDVRLASTWQKLVGVGQELVASLPLYLLALLVFVLFWMLGGWLSRRQVLFGRISPNPFIAALLGQVTHLVFIVLGMVLALILLDATALLGTILGAAGIVGLAVGFAVRDTVENYIASILLSLRNPFEVNDFVDVDGHQGNVVRLTSRATVLLSPDGNHIRIPNATVFKAVIINYTRHAERRFEFDVGVDTDQDLVVAQALAQSTLESVTGVLSDPPVLVIVQALGDSNVVLRCYGWVDQGRFSFAKVRSESIRLVKQAFDQAGIVMPEPVYKLRMVDAVPGNNDADTDRRPTADDSRRSSVVTNVETGDVEVDRTIEEKVMADTGTGSDENLLSSSAAREI